MLELELSKKRTALLSMDFQRDIALAGGTLAPTEDEALSRFSAAIDRAERALATARSVGLLPVHVRVAFRPGHDGANRHTSLGRIMSDLGALVDGDEGTDFVPALAPADGELVVTKRMVSAFAGTDLDQILRGRGIDTIILMGLVTHFVVEGTGRDAADRGYRVVTLGDCCASAGTSRHEGALDILGRLGVVLDSRRLAAALTD